MKKLPTWLIALLLLPVVMIGGLNLIAPEINEEVAFLPQPRPTKATTQAQLHDLWYANAQATNWKTPMLVTSPRAGVTRLTPRDPAMATFIAQDTTHEFFAAGDTLLTYSLSVPAGRPTDANRPLIVMCGGNAMDRYSAGVSYAQKGLPWGDVMLFDYPGYGDSTGRPTALSLEAAVTAVVGTARTVANGRRIIYWGHSLGGFVCGKLASKTPETAALIYETTARNAKEVVRQWTPSWMRSIVFPKISPSLADYDNARAVGQGRFPVLVLGAALDGTLPVPLARSLAKALEEQGTIVTYHEFPQALHWNVPTQPEFRGVASAFFETLRQTP
jgi:pimeloyl-ACP methyl ester carboxylesterase